MVWVGEMAERSSINSLLDPVVRHSKEKTHQRPCPLCCRARLLPAAVEQITEIGQKKFGRKFSIIKYLNLVKTFSEIFLEDEVLSSFSTRAMEETGVPEVVGDVLTWWFGIQFWSKGEPKNPTAHYDDLWRQKYSVPSSHKTITSQQDRHHHEPHFLGHS
mgnify:CR=1 FL=1